MAIDFFNTYPQNTGAKSDDYPFGSFRNETAPNAEDGTTLEQKWSNDWLAFFSRLLVEASMTPSGDVDTVKVSQYYDALLALIHRERREVSNALDGTRTDVAASENALRLAYELASAAVKRSGDTMTGDLTILNSMPSLILRNNTIPANNVGAISVLHNLAGNTVLSLTNERWNQEFRQVFPRKSGTIALTSDVSSKVSKSGDTMTGDLILQNKLSLRSVGVPVNNVGSLFKFENESGTLAIRRGRADGSTSGETRIAMPNKGGTVAITDDLFGVWQKWVDVTGSRILGAEYINNTSKPIMVIVGAADTYSGNAALIVNVGAVDIANYNYDVGPSYSEASVTFTVPPGSTYSVRTGADVFYIKKWAEMR